MVIMVMQPSKVVNNVTATTEGQLEKAVTQKDNVIALLELED